MFIHSISLHGLQQLENQFFDAHMLRHIYNDAFNLISDNLFDIIELSNQVAYKAFKIDSIFQLPILFIVCVGCNQFNAFNCGEQNFDFLELVSEQKLLNELQEATGIILQMDQILLIVRVS